MKLQVLSIFLTLIICLGWDKTEAEPNAFMYDVAVVRFNKPVMPFSLQLSPITVEVCIKNEGLMPVTSMILSLSYGGPTTFHNWTGYLAPNDSVDFTFPASVFAYQPPFLISVWTYLSGDQNWSNDSLSKIHQILGPVMVPYLNSFESSTGADFFVPAGCSSLWEKGNPSMASINYPYDGANVWATLLSAPYNLNSNTYLYSPFFYVSTMGNLSMYFRHWYKTADSLDGGLIEISADGGNTWSMLGTTSDSLASNWYNTQNSNSQYFSGNSGGWVQSAYNLSAWNYNNMPVIFRFHFFSDSTGTSDGWAIDDFRIVNSSAGDAGVIAILCPPDTTQGNTIQPIEVPNKQSGSGYAYLVWES